MTSKVKLVYNNNPGDFNRSTLPQWSLNFDPVVYDPQASYSPQDTIVWTDYLADNAWTERFGPDFKTVCNYQWDTYEDEHSTVSDNVLHFRPRFWVWICEYLTYRLFGYDNMIKPSDPKNFFLLLMNLRRDIRTLIFDKTQPWHSHSLVSYVGAGVILPGDRQTSTGVFQRHFNPDWYADTCFSLVSETFVTDRLYVSEKSFKPLAYQHPFMIIGTPGNVKYLQDLGFESFDHVIDESYDSEIDFDTRLNLVLAQLDTLFQQFQSGKLPFQDSESVRRIKHNYRTFYDHERIQQLWLSDVVDPVMEWFHD